MNINIEEVQQAIGIPEFKRTDLLKIALTHPSRIYENNNNRQQQDKQERDYRRLAILGDAILGTTVIDYLYEKYPHFNQGQITNFKSEIVSRKSCYKFAKRLKLQSLCLLGGSESLQEENKQIELFGEMFEALLGAIYLHYDRILSLASDWLIEHFIKDIVDDLLKSNQISEESPVDYSQAISSMDIDESYKLLLKMRQEADALVAQDDKLQTLLSWIHKKSSLVDDPSYKHTQVRAFYLAIIRILLPAFVSNCDPTTNSNSKVRNFFDSFNRVNALGLELSFKFNSKLDPANVLASILILDIEPKLKQALQELKIELPNPKTDQVKFDEWRQAHGQNWPDRIRQLIGYDLVLSEHQKELLKQYYEKNLEIIDSINKSKLAHEVKQDIEETLFLPTQGNNI